MVRPDGDDGENGFVEAASFRGGFGDTVWLCGWSATDEFGFLATPDEDRPAVAEYLRNIREYTDRSRRE